MDEKALSANAYDVSDYIIKMQKLMTKENDTSDFRSKGKSFWNTDCTPDIFEAHPGYAEGFLYKY